MAKEKKALEIQEQEKAPPEITERLRDFPCFIPRSDIYETDTHYLIVMDMPGVKEKTIDITLENDILKVHGQTDQVPPEGYSLASGEYQIGDYERSFQVTTLINQEKVEATHKEGVLKLILPKAEDAKARKVSITVS